MKAGTKALGTKVTTLVQANTGYYLPPNQALLVVGAAVLAVSWMIVSPFLASRRLPPMMSTPSSSSSYADFADDFGQEPPGPTLAERLQKAYETGFEDGANERPRQVTYRDPLPPPMPPSRPNANFASMPPMPPPKKSGFGMGQIMNIGFLGRQLYSLGGSPWNMQTFIINAKNMPTMQKVMTAFFAARILGVSPI